MLRHRFVSLGVEMLPDELIHPHHDVRCLLGFLRWGNGLRRRMSHCRRECDDITRDVTCEKAASPKALSLLIMEIAFAVFRFEFSLNTMSKPPVLTTATCTTDDF